ncbi:MAG: ArsR family transcriptional regulator [Limnohabitans sp.]|jgi:DNA-binding transcriptional ArsR family regulator|nr:ArsR family transcriptional regulator [Limnohabitans sp.]
MPDSNNESTVLQISKAPTWQAVRLPLRMRILETTRRLGETSVTELAHAVGLNRTALYFHLRHLEKAGLLVSRSGEATPGRRGKRPRYYRTAVNEVSFPIDSDSKKDMQRVVDFYRPWFSESRAASLDAKCPGGFSAKRLSMHWENLTEDEVTRIKSLCNEVEDIMRRARSRANSTRKAPTATHHLAMLFTPIEGHVMPGPEVKFKLK